MGTDFEDFMLRNFDLGKDGSGWSVQDLFEIAMEEAEQTITAHSFLCKTNTAKLEMLHLKPIRSEILKEMHRLYFDVQPELYEKIELLVQAAFIAGSETETYGSSHLVRALKKQKKEHWIASSCAGKKQKHNPVLVQAIKDILADNPNIKSAGEAKKAMKSLAKRDKLAVSGYYLGFGKKGTIFDGRELENDKITFSPVGDTVARYGGLEPIAMGSINRYYYKIIKKEL